uniref:SCP domain-containing protein 1 n=1 Tax=Lottia gigantea TaxID=225164 RepID=SCP1_LOTGI|nr:RecName: Full=SCP domain-containing protein 1; AltName: Full=Uncharacterized shell protein 2; Short=LUSP-2; Flags: Precursor [Lottia gigantea]
MEFKLLLVLCFNIGLICSQKTKPIGSKPIAVTTAAKTPATSTSPVTNGTGGPKFDLAALQKLLATFQMMQGAQGGNTAPSSSLPGVSSMPMPSANQISRKSNINANSLYQPELMNTNVPYMGNSLQQSRFQNQFLGGQFAPNVNVYRTNNHISSFEQMRLTRSYNLDEEQKFKILEEHNKFRSDVVQKRGTGAMNVLRWSEKLAAQASLEVMNCSYVNQGRGASLASVYEKYTGSSLVSEFMSRWSDEKNRFSLGENCSIQQTCRYSQAVWANTKQVGCAVQYCGDMSFIACSYSPVGNTVNQIAFSPSRGGICSACTTPPNMPVRCNSDHLCEWY